MSHSIVGKWGKNLAVRVPMEIARATGLTDGEKVEIETQDGDIIIIRRRDAHRRARRDAEAAAEQIRAESRKHSPGGIPLRELLEDGRRG